MARRRTLSESERRVWDKVTKTVDPLKTKKISEENPIPTQEEFHNLLSGETHLDAPSIKGGARLPVSKLPSAFLDRVDTPKSTPLGDRGKEKSVRRGQVVVEARLDLHGFTQDAAQAALRGFLKHHRGQGARCVLVITGKGRLGEGVIRKRLLHWLGQPDMRMIVSSYAQSHQKHGGAGAYYVFLKRLIHKA